MPDALSLTSPAGWRQFVLCKPVDSTRSAVAAILPLLVLGGLILLIASRTERGTV